MEFASVQTSPPKRKKVSEQDMANTTTAPGNAKVLYTGRTHTTGGREGATRSSDGFVDLSLAPPHGPHPAAENLFAAAWSACYIGAIEFAANQRKIKLAGAPAVDAQIEMKGSPSSGGGGGSFFLKASMNVSVPGVSREVAQDLAEAAHGICPYSKAVHGNIEVETTII